VIPLGDILSTLVISIIAGLIANALYDRIRSRRH